MATRAAPKTAPNPTQSEHPAPVEPVSDLDAVNEASKPRERVGQASAVPSPETTGLSVSADLARALSARLGGLGTDDGRLAERLASHVGHYERSHELLERLCSAVIDAFGITEARGQKAHAVAPKLISMFSNPMSIAAQKPSPTED